MYFASTRRAVAAAFVRRPVPLRLGWYVPADKPLVVAPFVQKHGPWWPMWYGFWDKSAFRQGRLSADPYHCLCGSMRYGCGDKRRHLEPIICPYSRTTARWRTCGTGLRTNPLMRESVCPETRTSMPHEVRVCGQTDTPRRLKRVTFPFSSPTPIFMQVGQG